MAHSAASMIGICSVVWQLGASVPPAGAAKDQSQVPSAPQVQEKSGFALPGLSEPLEPEMLDEEPEADVPYDPSAAMDVPVVETMELTPDIARRAIDAYADLRNKYYDQGIDRYDTLEEYVEQTSAGKRMEADLQQAGFRDITEWSAAIASVGFAYGALTYAEDEEIELQIEQVKADVTLKPAEREDLVAKLRSVLPSQNNKDVVGELMNDPDYAEKLQLLAAQE